MRGCVAPGTSSRGRSLKYREVPTSSNRRLVSVETHVPWARIARLFMKCDPSGDWFGLMPKWQ
jgi:hypothetical protein